MRVLIIEDEQLSAEKLQRMILKIDSTIEIAAMLESISSSVLWLQNNNVDLIFLDIHLADGSSFAIFEQINISTPIVFTTAFDQYAIDAFRVNSVDYLLKPFSDAELQRAFDKFNQLRQPISAKTIEALVATLGPKQYQKRFLVESGDSILAVPATEIAYFFADAKYVFLVDKSGKQHVVSYTIDKLSELVDPALFFRLNRKFLANLSAIAKMTIWPKGRIKITLQPKVDEEVLVSAERAKDFRDWLGG